MLATSERNPRSAKRCSLFLVDAVGSRNRRCRYGCRPKWIPDSAILGAVLVRIVFNDGRMEAPFRGDDAVLGQPRPGICEKLISGLARTSQRECPSQVYAASLLRRRRRASS